MIETSADSWPGPLPRSVAVMQPYFYPYAGYFRLLAAAETFVIFDDVQFPRRGRVHRCEVPGPRGALEWLTLPLARQPRYTLIKDIAFAPDARAMFNRRLARLPWLPLGRGPWAERVRRHLHGPLDQPIDFLEAGIVLVAEALDLRPRILRSSTLGIDRALRGTGRVIAVVRARGGRTYINAPGGRALYRADTFADAGLTLKFLAPYVGDPASILPALMGDHIAALPSLIRGTTWSDNA
jgi:WbqC-like protein family